MIRASSRERSPGRLFWPGDTFQRFSSDNMNEHVPVLYEEIMYYLQPRPGGKYIDGTVGAGGHSAGLLELSAPDGKILGLDRDMEAIAFSKKRLAGAGERAILLQASYAEMARLAGQYGFATVDGVLLDLGLSSRQLNAPNRGFSFRQEGPLDMRFDTTQGATAAELLNTMDEKELADLFWRYGEVRQSRKMARAIVEARPIDSTSQLASIASQTVDRSRKGSSARRIHPATRIFQALRIAVNEELSALEQVLPMIVDLLRPGGRMAIISFHSLEDRLVKQFIREQSRDCVCSPEMPICTCETQPSLRPINRKVIKPSADELQRNPRSRSARLRIAEKLAGDKQ